MYHGILNVYKEKGFTSHDVVAKLRGILGQRKIGHTGTLDPQAEGVLPVCLGKGTRLCAFLTDHDKTYEAVLRLGVCTDTQDMTGTVLSEAPVTCTQEEVRAVINSFVGESMQLPPMYSAVRHNGKKLYELARAGKVVERTPRPIFVYEIEVSEVKLPCVRFRVRCAKGTYIRTLCADIGERLGCGGCMQSLVRLGVGRLSAADALRLDEIEALHRQGTLSDVLFAPDYFFAQYPAYATDARTDAAAHNGGLLALRQLTRLPDADGQIFAANDVPDGEKDGGPQRMRLYDSAGRFVGLFGYDGEKAAYRPVKMFFEE